MTMPKYCDANTHTRVLLGRYAIAVRTLKDILPGEELTQDYNWLALCVIAGSLHNYFVSDVTAIVVTATITTIIAIQCHRVGEGVSCSRMSLRQFILQRLLPGLHRCRYGECVWG